MASLGDFAIDTTIHTKFTTRSFSTGAPTQLAGSPEVAIYEDNSTTEITGAETLTVDFDGRTGLNHLVIAATSANGFEVGKFYQAVIVSGTVGGVSVVGEVVCEFSIEATAALRPATNGREIVLDVNGGVDVRTYGGTAGTFSGGRPEVNATHAGGVAWGSGAITAASIANDAITAAKIADGAIDAGALAADCITAAKIATGAIDADAIADGAIDAGALAADCITAAKIATGAIDADAIADGAIDAGALAADCITAAKLAADVTTELQSGLATAAALTTVENKIDTIDGIVDSILADTGTDGVVVAAASKSDYRLSATGVDDILDEVIEGSNTLRQFLRGFAAALLAKASGLATTTAVFRDVGDTKDRITATVDASGNRSAVTLDLT
jgi:hypothetical protein